MTDLTIAEEMRRDREAERQEKASTDLTIAEEMLRDRERVRDLDRRAQIEANQNREWKRQAKANKLSRNLNIPHTVAYDLAPEMDERPPIEAPTPTVNRMLADPQHGVILQSDVNRMSGLERAYRQLTSSWSEGFEIVEMGDIGHRLAKSTATTEDMERLEQIQREQRVRPDYDAGWLAEGVSYALESLPMMGAATIRSWDEVLTGAAAAGAVGAGAGAVAGGSVLPVVGAVPGVAAGGATGLVVGAKAGLASGFYLENAKMMEGLAFLEARSALDENGEALGDDVARSIAFLAGYGGAALELVPTKMLLKTMPWLDELVGKMSTGALIKVASSNPAARNAMARIGRVGAVAGSEAITEVLQEALILEQIMARGGATDEHGNVLSEQRLFRYGEAAYGGAWGGGVLGAAGEAVSAGATYVKDYRVAKAEAKRQSLVETREGIVDSEIYKNAPETVIAMAKQLDEDGGSPPLTVEPEALNKLFQSGDLNAEQFPDLAEGLQEAAESAAEVKLSAESLTKLSTSITKEQWEELTKDIRTSPDEMTQREAEALQQEIDNQLDATMSEEERTALVNSSVENQIAEMLIASGQEAGVSQTQAKLLASAFNNLADRVGVDVDTLFQRYGLEITSGELDEAGAQAMLRQMDPAQVSPEFLEWFQGSLVVDDQGSPLTVYHGTAADFEVFDNASGDAISVGSGIYFDEEGLAPGKQLHFFSSDPEVAEGFAEGAELGGRHGRIMPVHLALKNPLVIDLEGRPWGAATDRLIEAANHGIFDGAVLRNSMDGFFEGKVADTYVAFQPNQIKSVFNRAPTSSPNILAQRGDDTPGLPRGFIEFGGDRSAFKITLTGKADLSTFMHESAHFFLEVMQDLVERGEAPDQLVKDVQAIRDWAGLKEGEPFTTAAHEKWARGFEAYLMEGRAPTNALRQAFQRFRAWMVFVYKRMTALNVELTDEVRGVMDRLIASDQAIAEAKTQIGIPNEPLPAEDLLLSDAEYRRYLDEWTQANERTQNELDNKTMRDVAAARKQAWRTELNNTVKELQKDLVKERGWQAWNRIKKAETKINIESVPKGRRRGLSDITVKEGGLDVEVVAEQMDYATAQMMIGDILDAKARQRALRLHARQMMEVKHGKLTPEVLADEAVAAVHSDRQQSVLLTEFRAIAKQANLRVPRDLKAWMNRQADDKIRQLTLRELEPARWQRAQLKAAQEFSKHRAAGDMTKAALAKRQQMYANAMHRRSIEAKKRIETIRRKLRPFVKNKRRAQIGKAKEAYLDAIDEILEKIQLKSISAAAAKAGKFDRLVNLITAAEARGEVLNIDEMLKAGEVKNYADLTLEEMEGVHDAVMNIWHLAKRRNQVIDQHEKRTLDEVLTEMETTAEEGKYKPPLGAAETTAEVATNNLRWIRSQLVKMEFMFGWLDGKATGGLMHRLIYQPIADAAAAEYRMMKRFNAELYVRMRNMPVEQKRRWQEKRSFMGHTGGVDGSTIIAAALNLGNAGNRQKLLEGYGWNEQQLMDEINAFMTKEDWDMVQHIWDQIDTLWPEVERTAQKATGLKPPKVEAVPIETPFGTYRGGYYPVVYDQRNIPDQYKIDEKTNDLFANNFLKPKLSNGFTHKRTAYHGPVLLDMNVLGRHLAEVVHYVTHFDAIQQANTITSNPRFKTLVTEQMGPEFYNQIRPWLQDIARNQDTPAVTNLEWLSRFMKHLRGGVSIMAMGFNVFTGFKQLLGVSTAADAMPARYWAAGLRKAFIQNPVQNTKAALAMSNELEPLITQFDRDIRMIGNEYMRKTSGSAYQWLVRNAFTHIGMFQLTVNTATWWGAYEHHMSQPGNSHESAIRHADAIVRMTQSSGAIKDLSAVQRGSEATRALTMFYTWFSVLYNRFEDIGKQQGLGIRQAPQIMRRLTILLLFTALMEELGSRAYKEFEEHLLGKENEDDEDDLGFITSVLVQSADTAVTAVPGLRQIVQVGVLAGGYRPNFIPQERIIEDAYRATEAMADFVKEGERPTPYEVKSGVRATSALTKTPIAGVIGALESILGAPIYDTIGEER